MLKSAYNYMLTPLLGVAALIAASFLAWMIRGGYSVLLVFGGIGLLLIALWPLLYRLGAYDTALPQWVTTCSNWASASIVVIGSCCYLWLSFGDTVRSDLELYLWIAPAIMLIAASFAGTMLYLRLTKHDHPALQRSA